MEQRRSPTSAAEEATLTLARPAFSLAALCFFLPANKTQNESSSFFSLFISLSPPLMTRAGKSRRHIPEQHHNPRAGRKVRRCTRAEWVETHLGITLTDALNRGVVSVISKSDCSVFWCIGACWMFLHCCISSVVIQLYVQTKCFDYVIVKVITHRLINVWYLPSNTTRNTLFFCNRIWIIH